MATTTRFLPRRLNTAFGRLAFPESLKALMVLQDTPGYVSYFDHFLGQGAGIWPASQRWSYPATVGTGTEVIAQSTAALGGVLSVGTGGNDNDSAVQTLGLHWRGTEGFYYIAKVKLSSVASIKFEVGVKDAITGEGTVNAKTTPTFTATDGACFIFDTDHNTELAFISVNAGVVGANGVSVLTMDTNYHIFEIVGQGSQVAGYADGKLVGGGAITSTAPLTPYLMTVARSASARELLADYQGMVGPEAL